MNNIINPATYGITAFLCILNVVFAFAFRKRRKSEVFSYITAGLIELLIFAAVLALHVGGFHHIPYRFPASLPVTRTEVGATLAVGLGLFPAAYWHRTSASQLRKRIAQDAKVLKEHEREGGVHVREQAPSEWMN